MTKLKVGGVYKITGEDCCLKVYFTSRVAEERFDTSDVEKEYPTYVFENGVTLDGWAYKAVQEPSEVKGPKE